MTEKPPAPAPADAQTPSRDEPDGRAYHVSLPMFEGPLDLLLHLIQKHELDILEIPIGFISKKYVEYIGLMEEFSIDVASEYLVMAATLAHIKSRSLLPPDPTQEAEDDIPEEEEDPRTELIRRLLEYQKYKNAADNLGGREVLGRDVFARGLATEPSAEEAPLAPLSLFKLLDAFEGVLKRAKQVEEHHINFERISISERIGQIVDQLRLRGSLRFEQLFDGDISRADMIVTFLALLEMTKLRLTHLTQEGPLEPITVQLAAGASEMHEFERSAVDSDWAGPERGGSDWDRLNAADDDDGAEHAADDDDGAEHAADDDDGAEHAADEADELEIWSEREGLEAWGIDPELSSSDEVAPPHASSSARLEPDELKARGEFVEEALAESGAAAEVEQQPDSLSTDTPSGVREGVELGEPSQLDPTPVSLRGAGVPVEPEVAISQEEQEPSKPEPTRDGYPSRDAGDDVPPAVD